MTVLQHPLLRSKCYSCRSLYCASDIGTIFGFHFSEWNCLKIQFMQVFPVAGQNMSKRIHSHPSPESKTYEISTIAQSLNAAEERDTNRRMQKQHRQDDSRLLLLLIELVLRYNLIGAIELSLTANNGGTLKL